MAYLAGVHLGELSRGIEGKIVSYALLPQVILILFDPVAAVLLSGIVEDKLIYLHVVAAEIFFSVCA